jgi:hypothetical protein
MSHVEMRRSKSWAIDGLKGWDVRCTKCNRFGEWRYQGMTQAAAKEWMVEHALKHDGSVKADV